MFACSVQLRYEQRISEVELELELQHKQQVDVTTTEIEPWVSRVQSLEEELKQLKETYQEKEKGLCDQIESLQQQLKHKVCTGGAAKFIKMPKILFLSFSLIYVAVACYQLSVLWTCQ